MAWTKGGKSEDDDDDGMVEMMDPAIAWDEGAEAVI